MIKNSSYLYIFIFILAVFLSSVSQIILKKSAGKKYKNIFREYANPYVITAYTIFVLVTLINIFAYKKIPVSLGAVLESLGYLFVAVMDRIVFHEKISRRKTLGLIVIVFGVILVCI